ncbi:ABC transporter substrate-binding protein [Chitinophaga qingshengii]|uniref:ABC transporter substrate-binding protein n=1 Tax=Chitinophaga qingshengii TaxID=1569794 RepID=A0ABR7TRD2_9BACT|nr:ABC transporter substrate-binding protein [Chitinophaga qingshengii]MBC9933038.1 ABC transporter substrate-binding protein [Chitinophaga qingshengii]
MMHMKPPLTIGFLMPYSGVYPYYSAHLTAGWLIGMGLDPARQQTIQFVPEFTRSGQPSATKDAAQKLVFFNRVDILSGMVSYKSVPDLIPIVESQGATAFLFDMGELIPYFPHISPSLFYASHQIWQSQYALGQWAQQKFGDGGHVIMPLYEAGYHLNSAFYHGAAAAGGTTIQATVLPETLANGSTLYLDNFFKTIEREKPPYVHAVFTGKMATRFLDAWKNSRFHKTIPLLVVESMAYDDVLSDVQHHGMELYSALTWLREDESKENRLFVKTFEQIAQQPANIYALMGYEAGLVWRELLPHAQKRDWHTVKQQLQHSSIRGPRGEKGFHPSSGLGLPTSHLVKINTTANKINKIILDQHKGIRFNDDTLQAIHDGCVSGWQNPFLCI